MHDKAIDDNFDCMLLVLRQVELLVDVPNLAIDTNSHETLPADLVENILVFTFAVLDDGAKHHEPCSVGQTEDLGRHLLNGLARDRTPAVRAVRVSDSGVEQPEVVINLGYRAD